MTEFRNIDRYHAWVETQVGEFAAELGRTAISPASKAPAASITEGGALDSEIPNSLGDADDPGIIRGYD